MTPTKGQRVYVLDPKHPDAPIEATVAQVRGVYQCSVRLDIDKGRHLGWHWSAAPRTQAEAWHESGRRFYLDRAAWAAAAEKVRAEEEQVRREDADRDQRRRIESVLRDYASRIRNGSDVAKVLGEVQEAAATWRKERAVMEGASCRCFHPGSFCPTHDPPQLAEGA